jgi:hypothetical protein
MSLQERAVRELRDLGIGDGSLLQRLVDAVDHVEDVAVRCEFEGDEHVAFGGADRALQSDDALAVLHGVQVRGGLVEPFFERPAASDRERLFNSLDGLLHQYRRLEDDTASVL